MWQRLRSQPDLTGTVVRKLAADARRRPQWAAGDLDGWSTMTATQDSMVTMQQVVQVAVLRAIEATPGIEGRWLAAACGADARDVERAVELLLRAGAIECDSRDVFTAQAVPPLWLTDEGWRLLREQAVSPVSWRRVARPRPGRY